MLSRGIKLFSGSLLAAAVATAGASDPVFGQEDRGWLGFQVYCTECVYKETADAVIWSFTTPPLIRELIVTGPAAMAGLFTGDTILGIDGVDITSDDGGRRFGALKAGVAVEFLVRRGGMERTVSATPGEHGDVFGEWHEQVVHNPGNWDSVRVSLQALSREKMKLQKALREAEEALRRVEVVPTDNTSSQQVLAAQLRTQIDTIRRQLIVAQARLRLQADSLAVRTLYLDPKDDEREADELSGGSGENEAAPDKARTATLVAPYQDAVAGARFQQMNEGLADYFSGSDGKGLLLVKLVEGTPAYEAGLREGDIVISINGHPVESVGDLRKKLQESEEAELLYVRKGERKTCKISK